MIENALGLFATVVLLTLLLLGIGINSAWNWAFKATVIVVATGVMLGCYFSLVGLLGWPTPVADIDRDLILLHAVVQEPGDSPSGRGSIYLWVRGEEQGSIPRALKFPYHRESHEITIAALQKQNGGVRQGVRVSGDQPGSAGNKSFSIFDMHKPRLTDKDKRASD